MEPQDDIYFSVKKRTQTSNDRKPRIFTKIAKPKKLAGKSYKFSELTDRKFNTKKRGKKLKEFKIQKNLQELEQKREARKAARKAPNPLPAIGAEKDLISDLKDKAELGLKTHEERTKILEKRKADKEIALELAKMQLEKLKKDANEPHALAPIKALEEDPFFKARNGKDRAEIKKFLRLNYNNSEKNDIVQEYLKASGPIRNTILSTLLATLITPPKSGIIEQYIEEGDKLYKTAGVQPNIVDLGTAGLPPLKHPQYDQLVTILNGKNIDDVKNPSSLNKIFKDLGIPDTEWKGKDVATKQAKLKEIHKQDGKGFNFDENGKGLNFNKEKLLGGALGHQMVSMKANEIINKLRGINKRHPYINKYTKLIKDSEDRFKQMIKGGGLLDNVTNFAKFFSKNWFDNILKPVATGLAAKAKAVQGGGIFDSFLAGLSAPFRLASKINPIFGFGVDKIANALNVPTISDVINR